MCKACCRSVELDVSKFIARIPRTPYDRALLQSYISRHYGESLGCWRGNDPWNGCAKPDRDNHAGEDLQHALLERAMLRPHGRESDRQGGRAQVHRGHVYRCVNSMRFGGFMSSSFSKLDRTVSWIAKLSLPTN